MIDLGPHAEFIWLSYAASLLVVAGLMVWVFGGEARNRTKLAELERRGITRRSASVPQGSAASDHPNE